MRRNQIHWLFLILALAAACDRFERKPDPKPERSSIRSYSPIQVTELGDQVESIHAGESHTCAVKKGKDGGLFCWGSNSEMELGAIKAKTQPTPIKFNNPVFSELISISLGTNNTCAIGNPKGAETRQAYCWGSNRYYQLGQWDFEVEAKEAGDKPNPHIARSDRPVPVLGPPDETTKKPTLLKNVLDLQTRFDRVCAVVEDEAKATHPYCWGRAIWEAEEEEGKFTITPTPELRSRATLIKQDEKSDPWLHDITQILILKDDTCVVMAEEVHCLKAKDFVFDGDGKVASAVAGAEHGCAIPTARNGVTCWGENGSGQLGVGGKEKQSKPLKRVKELPKSDVVKLAAGYYHTCALLANGQVWCWGKNNIGQIGNGTAGEDLTTATKVIKIGRAKDITAGANHSCAVLEDGTAWCWGDNAKGQLGQPVEVK